ncbi:hypothetical protein [Burkholderia ambifaria]|uniref:hypothetical protein n=1 Tax=Burkholderia ambifaria TaxID=152480 RepID=UPI00158A8B02|nr:hypothetical protein [Burkholderia ambifaria]
MADAAHAELYAESRRDGKCRRPVGMRGVGPHRIRAFHDFLAAAAIDIFRRITQTITNQTPIDYLFAFENRNAI